MRRRLTWFAVPLLASALAPLQILSTIREIAGLLSGNPTDAASQLSLADASTEHMVSVKRPLPMLRRRDSKKFIPVAPLFAPKENAKEEL
jgi:hypothetical protein